MNKLELNHIAPYLPYGLKVILGTTIRDLTAVSLDSPFVFVSAWIGSREKQMAGIENIKPILRPLSDLTKEIEVDEYRFMPYQRLWDFASNMGIHKGTFEHMLNCIIDGYTHVTELPYYLLEKLFEWHFDVFGLIDKGLAIDINTIESEVK